MKFLDTPSQNNLESPLQHFVDLKLMRIEQGIDDPNAHLSLRETVILIKGINGRLAAFVESVNGHVFMQDPIEVPQDWKESRDLFWETHVFKNEFTNNQQLLDFGAKIIDMVQNRIRNSQASDVQDAVGSFYDFVSTFPDLRQDLIEREAEARLVRFDRSIKKLASGTEFESNFIAAMNIELDGEVLIPFFNQNLLFKRTRLQEPGIGKRVADDMSLARASKPDLLKKATLFRQASHWWLRGRYGLAPEANGLLKSRNALDSEHALTELYMPRERPGGNSGGAINNNGKNELPVYARRHHYTWAIEYRPFKNGRKHDEELDHSVSEITGLKTIPFSNKRHFL